MKQFYPLIVICTLIISCSSDSDYIKLGESTSLTFNRNSANATYDFSFISQDDIYISLKIEKNEEFESKLFFFKSDILNNVYLNDILLEESHIQNPIIGGSGFYIDFKRDILIVCELFTNNFSEIMFYSRATSSWHDSQILDGVLIDIK